MFKNDNPISNFIAKNRLAVSVIGAVLVFMPCYFLDFAKCRVIYIVVAIMALTMAILRFAGVVAKKFCIYQYLMLIPASIVLSKKLRESLDLTEYFKASIGRNEWAGTVFSVIISIAFYMLLCFVSALLGYFLFTDKDIKPQLFHSICAVVLPAFIIYIYVPCDTYLANLRTFDFPYQYLLKPYVPQFHFICFFGVMVLSFLRPVLNKIVSGLLLGGSLCMFVQYMFMNNNLNLVGVAEMEFDKTSTFSIFNAVVWCVLLILPVVVVFLVRKNWKKILRIGTGGLLAIHLISYAILLITAGDIYAVYIDGYMDMREQYVVSQNKNVVVFIFDAADNSYIQSLRVNNPDAFDGLEDFTVYTNTCSVYKSTDSSFAQMFANAQFNPGYTGEEFYGDAWNSDITKQFYEELHNNNYVVNAFNMSGGGISYYDGKFDNAVYYNDGEKHELGITKYYPVYLESNFDKLLMYKLAPYFLKDLSHVDEACFNNVCMYESLKNNYYDDEFENNLNLTLADNDSNYLTIQHLNGPHSPCDDKVGETAFCLQIVSEYIEQMKELGTYDDATIIVMSDHGAHSYADNAATPVFMIKEAGVTHDSIQFTSAPEYHADMMATLAACAGITSYDEASIYGTPVFMWQEGMTRERTFYRIAIDDNYPKTVATGHQSHTASENVYHVYTYTGFTSDLQYMVDNGLITAIYPMHEYFG